MAKKFYAIKEGFDQVKNEKVINRIVNSWDECLKYVNGVKGAKYKSFSNIEEAEEYIGADDPLIRKVSSSFSPNAVYSYVDGSFNVGTGKYAYAFVLMKDDVITYIENGSAKDDSERDIRQIGGELSAAVKSVEYCINNRINELVIVHDYEGVCYHATGYWERREESSKRYFDKMKNFLDSGKIKITFLKVDSHTGDLYNEIADEFAKAAIDMDIKGEVRKILKSRTVLVGSEEIKNRFNEIGCSEVLNKIKVIEE